MADAAFMYRRYGGGCESVRAHRECPRRFQANETPHTGRSGRDRSRARNSSRRTRRLWPPPGGRARDARTARVSHRVSRPAEACRPRSLMSYRVVVAGATGACGTAIVRELAQSGKCAGVTALVRRPHTFAGCDRERVSSVQVPSLDALLDDSGGNGASGVARTHHERVGRFAGGVSACRLRLRVRVCASGAGGGRAASGARVGGGRVGGLVVLLLSREGRGGARGERPVPRAGRGVVDSATGVVADAASQPRQPPAGRSRGPMAGTRPQVEHGRAPRGHGGGGGADHPRRSG
eukprot:ctg_1028.g429